MPNKQAAIKALRQSKSRADHNAKIKSDIAALMRHVRKSVSASETDKAIEWLKQAVKKLDKAAQKGIIKKNTVARRKSRLSKVVSSLKKK